MMSAKGCGTWPGIEGRDPDRTQAVTTIGDTPDACNSASHGWQPVYSSYMTIPNAYTSDAGEGAAGRLCSSGAIHMSEPAPPMVLPANVDDGSRLFEMPKSVSFATVSPPRHASRMFAGLTSR
jgi:hypothetical protein